MKEDPVEFRKVENIKVKNISKAGISLEISALIENRTYHSFKISDARLDVMLNQVSIGQVKLKEDCLIRRRRAETYTFNVEASYSDLISGGLATLVNLAFKKQIRCTCKGWMEVSKWGIRKKIPVDFDQEVGFR